MYWVWFCWVLWYFIVVGVVIKLVVLVFRFVIVVFRWCVGGCDLAGVGEFLF